MLHSGQKAKTSWVFGFINFRKEEANQSRWGNDCSTVYHKFLPVHVTLSSAMSTAYVVSFEFILYVSVSVLLCAFVLVLVSSPFLSCHWCTPILRKWNASFWPDHIIRFKNKQMTNKCLVPCMLISPSCSFTHDHRAFLVVKCQPS